MFEMPTRSASWHDTSMRQRPQRLAANRRSSFPPRMSQPPQDFQKLSTLVRVVSIATDIERRSAFLKRAAATDLPWQFYDGLTELTPDLRYLH
jgi:hypothetical protein